MEMCYGQRTTAMVETEEEVAMRKTQQQGGENSEEKVVIFEWGIEWRGGDFSAAEGVNEDSVGIERL